MYHMHINIDSHIFYLNKMCSVCKNICLLLFGEDLKNIHELQQNDHNMLHEVTWENSLA